MVFTKNEKPVNLLNLQNLLTYENSYKGEIVLSAFKLQGSGFMIPDSGFRISPWGVLPFDSV